MLGLDVAVVGGGAAGLMCAIEAGKRGRRVLVIERSERAGKKILISGGGRCNFTNLDAGPDHFLSDNPHFCKSALARYTQSDFIDWVEHHGIDYHEKERGQLFCDGSSRAIVEMLLDECRLAGVRIEVNASVTSVEPGASGFTLNGSLGLIEAASVVVATGGLSIPKMGATAWGYEIARHFGHNIIPPRPGLVPLTLQEANPNLSGIALPVEARCERGRFSGGILFTHRGISGPAILQASSYWKPGAEVLVDFLPGVDGQAWLQERQQTSPNTTLANVLAERMPKRLAQHLCDLGLENRPLRQHQEPELRRVAERLHAWSFRPSGSEGYRTAEVTLGGVSTDDLSSTTMESRKVPGLYFIGEVVDVTGHLGGFNFQWAWSSGHAAGQVA